MSDHVIDPLGWSDRCVEGWGITPDEAVRDAIDYRQNRMTHRSPIEDTVQYDVFFQVNVDHMTGSVRYKAILRW